MSDDRRHAITLIALLGSVFSPYYARARARGEGDPLRHCSMNVALYGPRADRWALTERGRTAVSRTPQRLTIGQSSMEWTGDELRVHFDELTAPFPARLAGVVSLRPEAPRPSMAGADGSAAPLELALDRWGRHRWAPVAPLARAEVTLSHPSLRFSGSAYFDMNAGEEPLDHAFERWSWSRSIGAQGGTVTYDVRRRDDSRLLVAHAFDSKGETRELPPLAEGSLGTTNWGIERTIAADPAIAPRLLRTYEDTPFYARSLASASFGGRPAVVVHEALSLDRFTRPWVQALLPFRMRREA